MALKVTIDREVQPKEITSLIYGTGGLSYEWWHDAQWARDGRRLLIKEHDIDEALEGDTFTFVIDDPDEPEGSGKTVVKTVTMQDMVDAAGKAIAIGSVYEPDALHDDLGYCDAPQADCVMQIAVLGAVFYG